MDVTFHNLYSTPALSFWLTGKRSDDPEKPNWIPTIFTFTTAKDISKTDKKLQSKAKYYSLKRKREKSLMKWKVVENAKGTAEDNRKETEIF